MSTATESLTDDRDHRIDSVIYEFLSAIDRGESPNPAEWVTRHPELAPDLEEHFRDLDALGLLETRVGDYILLNRLGKGGEGMVFRARHRLDGNVVALKRVIVGAGIDQDACLRILEEARAIATLRHPNIITIFFSGEDHDVWYYTMELMGGGSLKDHIPEYRANPRKAVEMLEQVARGMHHAHSEGILHLDLKPENVLVDDEGRPRISDFGLAKRRRIRDETDVSAEACSPCDETSIHAVQERLALPRSQMRGTVPYMSPEMASEQTLVITPAADIYGLGAILYAMLTGRPPFLGDTIGETLIKVVHDNPLPPRDLNPKVNRELQAVCLMCLHKDPTRRYGSADALANDLGRWLRGEPTQAGGPTVGKHIQFWIRRNPIRVAAVCLAVVVLWLVGVAGSLPELQAANREEAARLAREVNDKLLMIQRAITLSAQDKGLIKSLRLLKDRPDKLQQLQRALDTFLAKTAEDYDFRFTGTKPLYNLYVLDMKGKLLADTNKDSLEWIGKDFDQRDYLVGLSGLERDAVYVSRVYCAVKDRHYKIAVSRWILDGPERLAVLAVNVAVGSRLVDLNMRDEPPDARLVSPMDWSYWWRHVPPPQQRAPYVVAMDHTYPNADFKPVWLSPEQVPLMPLFERNPNLHDAVDLFRDGAVTNYHRVGATPLVVVLRHPYPWPFSWVLATNIWRSAVPVLVLLAFVPVLLVVVVRRAALPLPGTGPVRPAKGESRG